MNSVLATRPVSLAFWDIDRTLVDLRGVSREMYARAFLAVIGRPLTRLADMAGRTERAILLDTLALNDVPVDESTFEAFYDALGDAARQLEGRMREAGRRLPGATEAIASLAADGTVQSVVTGNVRSVALAKLEAFNLADHLDLEIGGYGDDGSDRAVLVRLALKRAEARHGLTFPPERVAVIGDTPHDIRGARDVGVRAVGVASGGSTVDELAAAGAHAVLPDLTDLATFRRAVFGPDETG